jgi:hypothetical protein
VTDVRERSYVPTEQAANGAKPPPARERTPAEIEADIERTRTQLAGTIDEIADRVHPKRVAQRGVDRARSVVMDGNGRPRPIPVAAAAIGAVALIALTVWRKRH